MTHPTVDGPAGGPPGRELYWSGPWLIVHGIGLDSEDAAARVREQCNSRDVGTLICPIDEIQQVHLDRFAGLVVVLPSTPRQPDRPAAAGLRSSARLIVDYRSRRPEGLESILNGSCEWLNAGVVQVVGQRASIEHSEMRPVLHRVCARHYTNEPLLDVFQPYTRRFMLAQQPDGQSTGKIRDENIERLWRDVQAWGVTDIRDVPKLRKLIDGFRHHYENKRYSQLYRPIKNLSRNRLDIILDGPHDGHTGTKKTWMENGARVCRNVEKELRKIVPNLARPGGRNSTKDAQDDEFGDGEWDGGRAAAQLRRFYRNLRIIERSECSSN